MEILPMNPEQMRKIAKAIKQQVELDYEDAGPKAPYDAFKFKDVRVESRWNVVAEFSLMRRVIEALPDEVARKLTWIWCDSNCGANYVVGVKRGQFDQDLKWSVADTIKAVGGGHNGISFQDGDEPFTGSSVGDTCPDWGELD
jgi:hypothetical protein